METVGVGIIGTGFMGKAHAYAYHMAPAIFPDAPRIIMQAVADVNEEAAKKATKQFGFRSCYGDWKKLIADPAVHIVSITTPNTHHKEMALAAAAAGKHIHCEKPLAPTSAEAEAMMKAAEKAGVKTQVGFNYIKNPVLKLARDMVAAGELGDITGFRGIHNEDYMANSESPYTWRLDPSGGPGVIGDLGSHIIGMARFLLGPIAEVNAEVETIVKSRPVAPGASERRDVLVDDIARMMVRFERGCGGMIEANWVATGRKMQLGFEINGTKGSLAFNQERLNELEFYKAGGDPRHAGFTRIEAGPQHPPYVNFCLAAGHQLGFNDLKTIEVAEFVKEVAGGPKSGPDFREAWEVQKVVETAVNSSKARNWLRIS
jgi:predicted dehydrogenase